MKSYGSCRRPVRPVATWNRPLASTLIPSKVASVHSAVRVGPKEKKNSSESNHCEGNEFQNPAEDTSQKPLHHIRGTIQLAFPPSVGEGAPGRNQKFCPLQGVF